MIRRPSPFDRHRLYCDQCDDPIAELYRGSYPTPYWETLRMLTVLDTIEAVDAALKCGDRYTCDRCQTRAIVSRRTIREDLLRLASIDDSPAVQEFARATGGG